METFQKQLAEFKMNEAKTDLLMAMAVLAAEEINEEETI